MSPLAPALALALALGCACAFAISLAEAPRPPHAPLARARRYALQGTRWRVRDLWWRVSLYPDAPDLPRDAVDAALRRAFQLWASAADLRFHQAEAAGEAAGRRVHIDVRWERGAHGDWDDFDGRGGVLAHANYPSFGGAVHLDADERWALDDAPPPAHDARPSLVYIAAHEIGHALGVAHSNVSGALMAPLYGAKARSRARARARGREVLERLPEDDAAAAAALYGPAALPAAPAPPPPACPPSPAAPPPPLSAAVAAPDGFLYLLRGAWVFRHDGRRLSPPAPLPLARTWPGLPADGVDAAFAARSGKLFFFKGARYWRYSAAGQPPDHGYPRPLRLGFPGAPAAPDAALLWPANGQLYFFKGPLYWRYAGPRGAGAGAGAGAGRGYPRAVSAWRGVPAPPDAALAFRGHTYFFKGDSYVRFNDSAFAVEEAWPPFPRPIARWWFKCRSAHPPSPPPTPSMQPSEDALSGLLHALQPTTEV